MDVKLLIFLVALLFLAKPGDAEFGYNKVMPKTPEELESLGLKCIPGRTVVRMQAAHEEKLKDDETEEDDEEVATDTRRTHMNHPPKDESCKICVCSVEGKDEYCSRRPAMNVNECIRMSMLNERFNNNIPFEHERSLSFRIRRVGDDKDSSECVPLLSEYTDCSEANICSGCRRCSCTIEGLWSCQTVHDCPRSGDADLDDIDTISNAYEVLFNELGTKQNSKIVPSPKPTEGSRLLAMDADVRLEEELKHLMTRVKRNVNEKFENKRKNNGTVKFYHTVDELNEDTLKNSNISGTIEATKVVGVKVPQISRRTSAMDSKNVTGISDLHIEFNQPKDYDHQIVDNKIDSPTHIGNKLNVLNHEELKLLGNYTQSTKDKDLSKLIVNELKKGSEIIGDKRSVPVSNITFTPENDTLTAMAFIAGNLLSKLWKIEEDSGIGSRETEILKHEKIADLLELFKEPLTMRQEAFIKNALERLSKVVSKENVIKNISLCETLASSEELLRNLSNLHDETVRGIHVKCKSHQQSDNKQGNGTIEAITKLNNVLNLINKYENIQKKLHTLRDGPQADITDGYFRENFKEHPDLTFTEDEGISLNLFGSLLQKITNLILPKKNISHKRIMSKITHSNIFGNSPDFEKEIKEIIGLDSNNLTLTFKDKLILDYLHILKTNPGCFSKAMLQKESTNSFPKFEGSAIDSIIKLLKAQSLQDLVESVSPTSDNTKNTFTTETAVIVGTEKNLFLRNNFNKENDTLKTVKDRFKEHLNAILEDLIEIQNQEDISNESNKSASDILPCIYKLLNSDKNEARVTVKNLKEPNLDKITYMFESLKNNLKFSSQTRRSDWYFADPPKSSKVWERIIKNLSDKNKKNTRRNYGDLSFTKLKELIDNIDLSASTYKQYVNLAKVPVSSHFILLKALHASVQQVAVVLEKIKSFTENVINPSTEERYEIQKFVDDAARTVNLSDKILGKLKLSNTNTNTNDHSVFEAKEMPIYKQSMKAFEENINENSFKLTREQIFIQLIRNRIQLYLRLKEAKGLQLNQDVSYNVARKIMSHLASGNISLAKELFSAFIENSGKAPNSNSSLNYFEASSNSNNRPKKNPSEIFNTFENDNRMSDVELKMHDNFLKQLLKLKTMNA